MLLYTLLFAVNSPIPALTASVSAQIGNDCISFGLPAFLKSYRPIIRKPLYIVSAGRVTRVLALNTTTRIILHPINTVKLKRPAGFAYLPPGLAPSYGGYVGFRVPTRGTYAIIVGEEYLRTSLLSGKGFVPIMRIARSGGCGDPYVDYYSLNAGLHTLQVVSAVEKSFPFGVFKAPQTLLLRRSIAE